jgi:hypothetical protein
MRQAADLCSRWSNISKGWENPDLSFRALCELHDRLYHAHHEGRAYECADLLLAALAVDHLCVWIDRLREFPNAPANYVFRGMTRLWLNAVSAEPLTCEQIENMRAPR